MTKNNHGFTDEEIRPMAHGVYLDNQRRGIESTPEKDWALAIKLLRLERWLIEGLDNE